jgi:hypothetical protein
MCQTLRMTVARIAVIALALAVCTAHAQEHAKTTLTVDVTDPIGSVIPDARIMATDQVTGSRLFLDADANGHAVIPLDQGTYKLKVEAPGFEHWEESEVIVNAEMHRDVSLRIAALTFNDPIYAQPEIPVERQPVAAELPLIPMQQFVAPARPIRHRPHWF